MNRILIAGLFHETNTFLPGSTAREECELRRGGELLQTAGDDSPLGTAVETAFHQGWEAIPAIDLRAAPGPPLADDLVLDYVAELEQILLRNLAQGLDGVFLVLHGAMVSATFDDVEGFLLKRLRRTLGGRPIPIVGVLDLHANFTREMAENADALLAYRENPHRDAADAAARAMRLLGNILQRGKRPATLWAHPPILWPPTGTDTGADPMRTLEARAREIELRCPEILAVNVLAGFAFADVPDAGVSFTAVTQGDPDAARAELDSLAALAEELKEQGNVHDLPVDEVMRKLARHPHGPVILTEPADNVGGGAPGDGTGLLRALLEYRIPDAVVVLNDPQALAELAPHELGSQIALNLGGRGSPLDAGPVRLEVELVSRSAGRFTLEDPHSHLASMHGRHIEMGPCAVVRHENLTILLTSRKTPPFDLGQLRSQGIAPEKQFVIAVKAAVAHRQAYDPIAAAEYAVDTPGPCASRLQSFPYRRVRRPIYPLD
ncbi:MAG: M81 family metallopeptidase [Pirellulales bacterium]|nr:M81 family metallopeptidase [Pirellulales bacterium]